MLICALSGEPAKDPVVSPRSGSVFERHLVESYISTSGKDPVNDEPLAIEDLISIKSQVPVAVPPRPPAFNSIPTMLAAFQNEWDALALETYTLRKELHAARHELSEALYQYDAAVRVAAKAIKDRDEAQAALEKLSETFASEAAKPMDGVETAGNGHQNGTSAHSKEKIPVGLLTALRDRLFALHKKEKLSLPLTKLSKVAFTTKEEREVLADLSSVAGSADGSTIALLSQDKIETLPDGTVHDVKGISATGVIEDSGKSTPVAFASGSIIDLSDNSSTELALENVTAIVPHPDSGVFVALTQQNEWALTSFGESIELLYKTQLGSDISTAALHVDGVLLGLGTLDGQVLIFDLTTAEKVTSISTHYPRVNKIQFARNGYWLAVTSSKNDDFTLEIFDLRKNSLVHELSFDSPIDFVLDPSSQVLTTYETKQSKLLVHLYIKKGKQWVDRAAETEVDTIQYLINETSVELLMKEKSVRLGGVGNGKKYHYELNFS